jgi:type III secretory pathway lipoprotein EscJ
MTLLGCRQELARDVTVKDANRIVLLLSDAGIPVSQEQQGASQIRLLVEADYQMSARKIVSQYRLLPDKSSSDDSRDSLFPSAESERRIQERSLIRNIEDTLKSFGGVLDVRLFLNSSDPHTVMSEFTGSQGATKSSASVVLQCARTCAVTQDEIKKLVSGASGITINTIEVIIKNEDIAVQKSIHTDQKVIEKINQTLFGDKGIFRGMDAFLAAIVAIIGVFMMVVSRRSRGLRV